MNRSQTLDKIRQNSNLDILIIGAGINGIGTFRDLALQGVNCLIVDKGDFCSGASAASSHMVHGGIRYLENGEFRLVREAVQERNRLIENAPHLVSPLPTNIPIFKRFSGLLNAPLKFLNLLDRPGERGALVIKMGLMMYDAYTGDQGTVPKHQFISRANALQQYPKLNPNILNLARYYDGMMPSPERIAIEVLLDGLTANSHCHALNYVSAMGADSNEVTLRDEETGDTFAVQPKLVINAAGPWIDFANANLGHKTNFVGGTKGSHIVVDYPELRAQIGECEFFFENHDGRIVLIFPLHDKVIIGTSDLKIDNPSTAICTEEEVDYFLELVGKVFPNLPVTGDQIVYRFSGVRPLPASDVNSTGQISRDHSNKIIEPADSGFAFPVFNLIGGKWTTFRAFSEHTANEALVRLGVVRKVNTRNMPIGGGHDYPKTKSEQEKWVSNVAGELEMPAKRIQTLFDRYGTRAIDIAIYISKGEDDMLTHHPTYSRREIMFIAEQEQVVHVTDFLQRRSLIAMKGELTGALLAEITEIIGELHNWSTEHQRVEIDRTITLFAQKHQLLLKIPR